MTTNSTSLHFLAIELIDDFLQRHDYQLTREAFLKDVEIENLKNKKINQYTLESLLEERQSKIQAQEQKLNKTIQQSLPTDLNLSGPSFINYKVLSTFNDLHSSNILSLSIVKLPRRIFSTQQEKYLNSFQTTICSTGADKNIVFSSLEGELIEIFEGGKGSFQEQRHGAAILSTIQNPIHLREFISSGMDSKVIVWDLLHLKPIQILTCHSKFVVRLAISKQGDYLATCSYDKTICLHKRRSSRKEEVEEETITNEDTNDMPKILDTQYDLIHTINTRNNPESILFVKINNRDWLVFTQRSDCFVHYVALPMNHQSTIEEQLAKTSFEEQVEDFKQLSFNTNPNPEDFHVSYSLLHLTLHPLGNHISIQTGDHSIPSSGFTSIQSNFSRIILMPLLSNVRTTTLYAGVSSSGFVINRHSWNSNGSAAWLTSEDGILRLIDVQGKTRASIRCHGISIEDETISLTSWSRGGNTVIKDVLILDSDLIASCGFDHTIRLIGQKN